MSIVDRGRPPGSLTNRQRTMSPETSLLSTGPFFFIFTLNTVLRGDRSTRREKGRSTWYFRLQAHRLGTVFGGFGHTVGSMLVSHNSIYRKRTVCSEKKTVISGNVFDLPMKAPIGSSWFPDRRRKFYASLAIGPQIESQRQRLSVRHVPSESGVFASAWSQFLKLESWGSSKGFSKRDGCCSFNFSFTSVSSWAL